MSHVLPHCDNKERLKQESGDISNYYLIVRK